MRLSSAVRSVADEKVGAGETFVRPTEKERGEERKDVFWGGQEGICSGCTEILRQKALYHCTYRGKKQSRIFVDDLPPPLLSELTTLKNLVFAAKKGGAIDDLAFVCFVQKHRGLCIASFVCSGPVGK